MVLVIVNKNDCSRKLERVQIDEQINSNRRLRSQTNSVNEAPIIINETDDSQSLNPSKIKSIIDSENTAPDIGPSLYSFQTENLCDIVPHVSNDILQTHILTIISQRFAIDFNEVREFLKANKNSQIPGLHEKFTLYVVDFLSVFENNIWLTNVCVEEYIGLVLLTYTNKNVCLIGNSFQFMIDKNVDDWTVQELESHCNKKFGCGISDADFILVPLIIRSHFVLTIFDVVQKKGIYFDSLRDRSRINAVSDWFFSLVDFVWNDGENWELGYDSDHVVQNDNSSCGIYTCMNARRFVLNDVMPISSLEWQYRARLIISLSLLCSKLLPL